MANGSTSYQDWLKQNPDLVQQVAQRYAAPAAPATPAPAAAAPEAANPTVAPVVNITQARNPYAAQAQVQDERITGLNNEAASHQREGQAKTDMANQQAVALGEYKAEGDKWQGEAEDNFKANRTQIDAYKKQHAADLQKLREPIKGLTGGQKAMNIVAGIVGAMASQGGTFTDPTTGQRSGGNQGLAMGMGMLQSHIESGVQKQLQERDLLGRNVKETEDAIAMLHKDSSDNLETTNKILANRWFLEQRNLEKIAKEAEGTAYGENAYRLSLGAADKARAYEEEIINGRIKKAEAQRAAGGKGRLDETLSKMTDEELLALGTKPALEKYKTRQGLRKGEADIDGTLAATEAAKAKADGGQASGPQGADERKLVRLLQGVDPAVRNLRRIAAQKKGTLPHPSKGYLPDLVLSEDTLNTQSDLDSVANILLRDESGAAIGEDEAEKKKRGWGITSGDPEVRRRGLQKMLAEYDSRLAGAGASSQSLVDEQAKEAARRQDQQRGARPGSAPAAAPAPVRQAPPAGEPIMTAYLAPDGKGGTRQVMIPPHLIKNAEARGLVPASTAALGDMSDADYQAQVLKDSGY